MLAVPDGDEARGLAALAAVTASGVTPPAGPAFKRGSLPPLGRERDFDRHLSVGRGGFTLHDATRVGPMDERGREALLKYVLPPIAQERVTQRPDGLVRIALKKPFSDGTFAVDLDPLSLLTRLCASVPPPRFHTVRYSGVLASTPPERHRRDPPAGANATPDGRPAFAVSFARLRDATPCLSTSTPNASPLANRRLRKRMTLRQSKPEWPSIYLRSEGQRGRLTFTDGALHSSGMMAFLACAEDSPDVTRDGPVSAVTIGVLDEATRTARLAPVLDEHGAPLLDKAEGLAFDTADRKRAFVVTDRDDPAVASELLELRLGPGWS